MSEPERPSRVRLPERRETVTATPVRCPWPQCVCTHSEGCVAGWLDLEDEHGRSLGAKPCRNCRPEVADLFRKPRTPGELRAVLPLLPRPSRRPVESDGERPWWS